MRRAWRHQRYHARRRGIPFLLTFEQWSDIWISSGHWHQRGRGRGKFCMARFGDKGAYEVGNVKIIPYEENTSEGQKGKPKSLESRRKISEALRGNTHTLGYKFDDPDYLKRRGLEHRGGHFTKRSKEVPD